MPWPIEESRALFRIIDMAKRLNLRVIAEGVETEAQAAYLRGQCRLRTALAARQAAAAEQFKAFYLQNRQSRAVVPISTGRAIA